jgi:hypothetical protein
MERKKEREMGELERQGEGERKRKREVLKNFFQVILLSRARALM